MTTAALASLVLVLTSCDGNQPGEDLDFEPAQGSAFYNWFGGEIYLSFADDHAGTLWVLMTMDCESSGAVYAVHRSRDPAEQQASVRMMVPDGSLPRFYVGEVGTVEIIDGGDGELSAAIHVTLIDEETGAWVTLDGVYEIQSIAMS